MLVLIAMAALSPIVPYPAIRWVGMITAGSVVVFNVVTRPYPGRYGTLLIGVGFVSSCGVIWQTRSRTGS